MKLFKSTLLAIVAFTISTLFSACSDDNDKIAPITLINKENTTIKLSYPNTENYYHTIKGGDGKYSAKSDNPEVVIAEIETIFPPSQQLSLKVVGLGHAKVTITDESQNSLIVDVEVDYLTNDYRIKLIDVKIVGDDLTEKEKEAIIEKQIGRNPVKVGGGYKFIFNNNDNANKNGEATIYANTYGTDGNKQTFDIIELDKYISPESLKWGYGIDFHGENRVFVFGRYYPKTKSSPVKPRALIEDVTEIVWKEYPKTESVIIYQVIEDING